MKSLFEKKDGPIEGRIKVGEAPVQETSFAKPVRDLEKEFRALLADLEGKKIENQKLSTSTNVGVTMGLDEAINGIKRILNG